MGLIWFILILMIKMKLSHALALYNTKFLHQMENTTTLARLVNKSHTSRKSLETTPTTKQINLGVLYDCTSVTPMGVFEYPELKNCNHEMSNMNNDLQEMKVWKGRVKKYQPITTKFEVALCEIKALNGFCDNNGFTNTRTSGEKELHMSHIRCWRLTQQLYTIYDGHNLTLHKTRENYWETTENVRYNCEWAKSVRKTTYKITVRIYPAQIIGDSKIIEQHVFDNDCSSEIPKGSEYTWCTSNKAKMKALVWHRLWYDESFPINNRAASAENFPVHNREIFKDLGEHEIKQLGDYILIESLLMGGAIQQEMRDEISGENEMIQLDNGIVIEHLTAKPYVYNRFKQTLKTYAKLVGADVMAPILEGHLASIIIEQKTSMIREWQRICFVQNELQRIQKWMINTFPTSSAKWIHQHAGVIVHPAGDALHVSKCMQIESYKIHYDRKLNGTCYRDFPIETPITNTTRFLRITDRQIVHISSKLNCSERPQHTYLKASNGTYYLITSDGEITETHIDRDTAKEPHDTNLMKLRGYDPDWIVKIPEHLEPYAMTEIISYTQDAIREMQEIRQNQGGGNLLVGIVKAIGTVIEKAADGGSEIIKSIGSGIKNVFEGFGDMDEKIVTSIGSAGSKIIDSTGGAIKNTGTGIGNVFHGFFGGVGGSIKWAITLISMIIFFYVYRKKFAKFLCRRKEPEKKLQTSIDNRLKQIEKVKQRMNRDINPDAKDIIVTALDNQKPKSIGKH